MKHIVSIMDQSPNPNRPETLVRKALTCALSISRIVQVISALFDKIGNFFCVQFHKKLLKLFQKHPIRLAFKTRLFSNWLKFFLYAT